MYDCFSGFGKWWRIWLSKTEQWFFNLSLDGNLNIVSKHPNIFKKDLKLNIVVNVNGKINHADASLLFRRYKVVNHKMNQSELLHCSEDFIPFVLFSALEFHTEDLHNFPVLVECKNSPFQSQTIMGAKFFRRQAPGKRLWI